MENRSTTFLQLLLGVLVLIGGYYIYKNFYVPCVSPITYRIGTFDTRFALPQEDFMDDLQESSSLWNSALDKTLLQYDPNGKVAINLVYDDRQKTTEKRAVLEADSNKIKALATSVREEYTALKDSYTEKQKVYEATVIAYQNKQKAYNEAVSYWNTKGGAPHNEYASLVTDRDELTQDFNALESKRNEVNELIIQINQFSDKYNLLVDSVNQNIETINQTAGTEFQEGIYDPNKKAITIYEFESKKKLLRVLAHEFGHALNMNHNNNPESIMYMTNKSNVFALSQDDIASLKKVCHSD